MDSLMKYLYQFVLENRMGSLREDQEYKNCELDVDMQTARLEAALSREQRKELHWLIDAITFQDSIREEHLFQAALSLSRELNALVRA